MIAIPLHKGLYGRPAAVFPEACEPLEEVGAAQVADAAAALAFAFGRLAALSADRPLALVTTDAWRREHGRPFARGLAAWGAGPERLVWIRAHKEAEALWALEEALKSAARRRWRIAARPSRGGMFDAAAPGPVRLRAELVRRRDGPPGGWDLEQDDETGRLRLDAGLADHRLDQGGSGAERPAAHAAA
jgi:hypothetical protein